MGPQRCLNCFPSLPIKLAREALIRFARRSYSRIIQRMNNLKMKILERVYAEPWLTVGGLADRISPGRRTEKDIQDLVKKGYLLDKRGLHLSEKGLACIDSSSRKNRMIQVGKYLLAMAGGVVIAVAAQWLWSLFQSAR